MNYSHNIQQVVLLSAGLDIRAFRLNWEAGTHIYEFAHSDVLHYLESVIVEYPDYCEQHSICADLREPYWSQLLLKQSYQSSELSIWLLEGFMALLKVGRN